MHMVGEVASVVLDATTMRQGRILVLDQDEGVARAVAAVLRRQGYEADVAHAEEDAVEALRQRAYDLALVALAGDAEDTALVRLHGLFPSLTLVALTRVATFESALDALRHGAYDYLVKPIDVDELCLTVERALDRRRLERELADRMRELEAAYQQLQSYNARLQQQVNDATTELRHKVEALDDANAQLRHSQEEHDRFVAMVAHEMRGPLNPIINYAQLAKRPGISHDALEQYTDIIVDHAFRLNRLVDDLLTATRLSTGHFTLRRAPCDVAAAVEELVAEFRSTVRERTFSLLRPESPVIADVDSDRVVQAVRNLLDNAVKYSTEGGAVEVLVAADAQRAQISVRDHGAGIPEEQMRDLFQPFKRLNKETDVAGSGLGLFITRGIVAAHGGDLTVSNGIGTERALGATFTISLPLAAARPETAAD
jgi:signal transduction histidine kinase